jgi:hypothetical protein
MPFEFLDITALTNPVCRTVLERAIEKIDATFLSRLKRHQQRVLASPDELPLVAALLGATLHSLALRARAGWSRKRLRNVAAGAVRQVIGKA